MSISHAMALEVAAWFDTYRLGGTYSVPATLQDTGDTVTHTAHGLVNGDKVVFDTITTTTGLTVGVEYFVVSATANTFQVSTTAGGAAVALTTDGTAAYRKVLHDSVETVLSVLTAAQSMAGDATSVNEVTDYAQQIQSAFETAAV